MNRQSRVWKKIACFLVLLMSFLMLLPAGNTMAQVATAVSGVNVYDDADLFTNSEERELQAYLEKMSKKSEVEIYVLTSDDSGYGATDRYIEDFYDEGYREGTIKTNAVLMHIDMEERYVNIQAYGTAQRVITDQRADGIIDDIFSALRAGNYFKASKGFADGVEKWMNYVPLYKTPGLQLIVAMIIAGISVAVMASSAGGKMTAGAAKYQDSRHSGLRARRDDYIRTSVSKRRRPQSSSSGGGGGGGGSHHSSGGHSHSSAGRHF